MIDNKNDKNKAFRPSAVPLVTVDPYFSIWSMCDKLNDGVTSHWTGRRNPMTAGVVIDNKLYILIWVNWKQTVTDGLTDIIL